VSDPTREPEGGKELRGRLERLEPTQITRPSREPPEDPDDEPRARWEVGSVALGFGGGLCVGGLAVLLVLARSAGPREPEPHCPTCPTPESAPACPTAASVDPAPECAPCPADSSPAPAAAASASAGVDATSGDDAACEEAAALARKSSLALGVARFRSCNGPKKKQAYALLDAASLRLATQSQCRDLPVLKIAAAVGASSGLARCASRAAAADPVLPRK